MKNEVKKWLGIAGNVGSLSSSGIFFDVPGLRNSVDEVRK